MGIDGLAFAVREAFSSIKRNSLMSLIAVSTVAVCLFSVASIFLLAVNLSGATGLWENQVQLRVFLAGNLDAKGIKDIQERIQSTESVSKVVYVSREEGLERLRQQFGQQKDLLAGIESSNPLPNSFEVKVVPPQKTREVALLLEKIKGIDKVQYAQEVVETLFRATAAVKALGAALLVAMGVGAVFIISNTIRIAVFSRRREIGIMKLVGATDSLIRGPFLIEGFVLGVIGSLLSAAATIALYGYVFATVQFPFLPLVSPQPVLIHVSLALLITGGLLGGTGSILSIRKYLRV